MEDNTSKRTSGNDILRDAAKEAQKVSRPQVKKQQDEEVLVFHRERVTRQTPPAGSVPAAKRPPEHTAEIRGGAVVRSLKKQSTDVGVPRQGASPAPAKRGDVNTQKPRPTGSAGTSDRTTAAIPAVKPTATPRTNGVSEGGRSSNRMRQSANEVRRPAQPQRRSSNVYGEQNTIIQNRTPAPAAKPQTRLRTENDDYEIDEATYKRQPRSRKEESGFADSASSAVMSLVKAVVYIVAVIAVSVVLSIFTINTANDVFKFVTEEKMVTVDIPEHATIDDVTDALFDAGAIKYKWAFKFWSNLKDPGAEFVKGSYDVSTTLNYDYLRATFKKSSRRVEVRVTIPEGYTVDEIINLFVEEGLGTREAFCDVINNYEFDYDFLKELTVSPDRIWRLEGYLFPDTYNFYLDSSDEDNKSEITAIKKLLDNFERKFVSEYYARASQLGLTVDEAITLASIIEKETRYADELGAVSSVFHNRLKYSAQYPYLNSDATIMYAIAHDTGSRLDTMTGKDTEYETPYNTYKYKGLPPGPIANPGINAIKYALYPSSTDYFYFVSTNSGRTLFATTSPEHQANVDAVRAGA